MALRALPALVPDCRKSQCLVRDSVVWSPTRTRLTLNLASVEGVNKGNVLGRLVLVVQAQRNLGALGELADANQVNKVGRLNLLVVGRVLEGEL